MAVNDGVTYDGVTCDGLMCDGVTCDGVTCDVVTCCAGTNAIHFVYLCCACKQTSTNNKQNSTCSFIPCWVCEMLHFAFVPEVFEICYQF